MSILIVAVLGIILGFTSHITNPWWPKKVLGIIEGLTVVSAANWLFYSLGLWWWVAMLLGIVTYAIYLMVLQGLLRTQVLVDQAP
jgi:hypothetical protein